MDIETTPDTAHDLSLLSEIEQQPDINQAALATRMGIAVGTVNWHLKRLIAKGAIKVKRAERKKLRYIITPEGIALRARLAVDFVQQSFKLYRLSRDRATEVIKQVKDRGYTSVHIDAEGDIADVIRLTCLEQGIQIGLDETAPILSVVGLKIFIRYPGEGVA